MTQKRLAATLDTTITTVSSWENGRSSPRCEDLGQLSNILNASIDWIVTGEEYAPALDAAAPPPKADVPAKKTAKPVKPSKSN